MRVVNVHRREVDAPNARALLDGLSGRDDRLWPRTRWPPLRLDQPLRVGATGGHGPIRYEVEAYEPGRRVRFRFLRPRGFDGVHEFRVGVGGGAGELCHVLDVRLRGAARVSWPLIWRPLHDALIEDALDNAERVASGQVRRPATWGRWVRLLRRVMAPLTG